MLELVFVEVQSFEVYEVRERIFLQRHELVLKDIQIFQRRHTLKNTIRKLRDASFIDVNTQNTRQILEGTFRDGCDSLV